MDNSMETQTTTTTTAQTNTTTEPQTKRVRVDCCPLDDESSGEDIFPSMDSGDELLDSLCSDQTFDGTTSGSRQVADTVSSNASATQPNSGKIFSENLDRSL